MPVRAASTEAVQAPTRGGTLEFAVESEPANYDCHANVSFAFLHPVAPHYSTLLKFDGVNYPEIKGDLAESWSVSADQRTYTLKLWPDVRFHDGSPLTSADVKASYQRIVEPPAGVTSARRASLCCDLSVETRRAHCRLSDEMAGSGDVGELCLPELHLQRTKIGADPQYPRSISSVAVHSSLSSMCRDRAGWQTLDRAPIGETVSLATTRASERRCAIAAERGGQGVEHPRRRDRLSTAGDPSRSAKRLAHQSIAHVQYWHQTVDDAGRRALSLAIDRWQMVDVVGTTYLKFVGGIMRPGF
jgi:peptide/nickel transport system substrate-binding protein